jgi:hypothetical protein
LGHHRGTVPNVTRSEKLFRAIVVMGAAMTSNACFDPSPCAKCVPDAPPDTVATVDAAVDSPDGLSDAPADVVLIL